MTVKTSKGYILFAAMAAIAAPALLSQPAAAEAGTDYRYEKLLATETAQEKTKRTAARSGQQTVRTGTGDNASRSVRTERRSYRFNFDVPVGEEQHYRR